MSDIVERLRRLYVQHGTDYVQEAANEIEMQRVAMQVALGALEGWCDQPEDSQTYDECMERAMRAITLLRSQLRCHEEQK